MMAEFRPGTDTHANARGWAIIAGVVVVVVIALLLRVSGDKPGRDCIQSAAMSVVFVMDHTDEVPQQTLDEIVTRAEKIARKQVPEGARVSVFAVTDLSRQRLQPKVSVCKPTDPDSASRINSSPKVVTRQFSAKYMSPITAAVRTAPTSAPESPIAAALADLSVSTYLRAATNRLVVFSDMMENTPEFSLYRCQSADSVVDEYSRSRVGAVVRPKFRNTHVSLHFIPRLGLSPSAVECRMRFWIWYFGDNSGPNARFDVDDLPGGSSVNPE